MGIIVKQFDGVSVTPKDDAVVRDLLFSEYGIFRGCGISFLGINQIRIASGYMIVKGRAVAITEETVAAQLSSNGKKRGRLYIHFDFSNQTTPAQFLTQVTDQLPELIQEKDANYNDGIFEIELCNYDVSEVAVSNIIETCPIITGGMDLLSTIEEVMANTTPGKGVDALVISEINSRLGDISKIGTNTYNSFEKILKYYVENGYLPDIKNNAPLIPIMSTNTSNNCIISGSKFYQEMYDFFKAFDNSMATAAIAQANGSEYWLKVQLPNPKTAKKIKLVLYNGDAPKSCNFILQGSNNNNEWKNIANINGGAIMTEQTFYFENDTPYKYYRLYTTNPSHHSVAGFYYIGFFSIQLYGSIE